MPDISALYPQPPQQQQNQNLLMQNPLSLATTVSGLQTQALQRQQLQLQITNEMFKAVANGFGSLDPNSSADDVNSRAALLSRMFPNAAPIISHFQDRITSHPNGISHGITESAVAANPERAAEPALGPPNPATGAQPYTTAAGNVYAGAPAQTPLETDKSFGMTAPTVAGSVPVRTTTIRAPATTLGLGANESNAAMLADQAREAGLPQDLYPWQQALSKMQELQARGETFGPGSKGRQELESYAQTLAPSLSKWFGVDPSKVTGYAEVEKYLQQGLGQRANNFGPKSNEGLAAAAGASPNVNVTDLAGVPLIKSIIAMRRMEYAQVQQAAKNGGPAYLGAKSAIGTQLDPRAFSIDMMDPKQIQTLQKTLKGAERAKFNASLRIAIDNGLISPK
jgi:hypothetical protein